MGQIEIHTLGGFQVSRNGEILKGFDSDKIRILLAFFAVEAPQPYRRETLAALLWPDANGTESRANLRWALSNLRKIIGDRGALCPFLLTTRQTIQRNPAANFYSDVAEFLAQSQHSLPNPAQLEQATQLYRGEFLAGLNPKDSLPLDEWLLLKRESLARTLVETLKTLSQHYQQNGEYHKALPHARRFVELEPWQEQGHRQLMRLLEATGQRHAALAQYQQCRNILAQTLGIEPETATTELYRRIQNGSPAPASHQPPPLPNPLTPLIGREREFEQICGYLTQSNCRLLTLTGPGGIGKTRLALEIAHHLQAEFRQGVVFVPLSAVQSPAGLLPALADALNFTSRGQGNPRSQLLEFLRDQEILLVLDNFE
ncbi:MAG TPA: SARP family transcriptional regulator, partial [Chloroflexi bacterium]|nr:SARP family transcriptional regulator [Chloroflexota bacterium]